MAATAALANTLISPNIATLTTGGTVVTVCTAGALGAIVPRIRIKGTVDPSDSIIAFYQGDGTTDHVFSEWDISNPATGSSTVATYEEERQVDWFLPPNHTLKASVSVAPASGSIKVFAVGAANI
jgi:hypothetical protein